MQDSFYVNFYKRLDGTMGKQDPISRHFLFGSREVAKTHSDIRHRLFPERRLAYRVKVIPHAGFDMQSHIIGKINAHIPRVTIDYARDNNLHNCSGSTRNQSTTSQ